jgi:hypothetical protein
MTASGITDTEANATLDARIEAGSTVALTTTSGTATAAGTKVVGGSYADQTPTWAAAASREKHNNAVASFVGMDVYHSAGAGGARSWFLPIAGAPKSANAGDTVQFVATAISLSLANTP